MTPFAYYNEFDEKAAAWLRELIKRGHIALGVVDTRSITDVLPSELQEFTQCHFFAGIGVWSYALRRAGWADNRPVWTGSCPCQPFSKAGKQKGNDDARHLAPVWLNLIRECRPSVLFGEQVASAIGHGWWDDLQSSLEGEGYACGVAVLGAHSAGAPHLRQRLWFVAHNDRAGCSVERGGGVHDGALGDDPDRRGETFWSDCDWIPCRDGKLRPTGRGIHPLVVAHAQDANRRRGERGEEAGTGANGVGGRGPASGGADGGEGLAQPGSEPLADGPPTGVVRSGHRGAPGAPTAGWPTPQAHDVTGRSEGQKDLHGTKHGCACLVRTAQLALGYDPDATAEARTRRLKGYGNAICAPVAEEFIRAFMEVTHG